FFFQAEDGIRDDLVTGVQTCALPICGGVARGVERQTAPLESRGDATADLGLMLPHAPGEHDGVRALEDGEISAEILAGAVTEDRSEERRVGKEGRGREADNH